MMLKVLFGRYSSMGHSFNILKIRFSIEKMKNNLEHWNVSVVICIVNYQIIDTDKLVYSFIHDLKKPTQTFVFTLKTPM